MADRGSVRVVNIYATPWRFLDDLTGDEGKPESYLGAMGDFYEVYRDQLPRLIPPDHLPSGPGRQLWRGEDVRLTGDPPADIAVPAGRAELFTLPSNQIVLAVTFELAGLDLADPAIADQLDDVLNRCIDADLCMGTDSIWAALQHLFPLEPGENSEETDQRQAFETGRGEGASAAILPPERHQLVFVSVPGSRKLDEAIFYEILFRREARYGPEFVDVRNPGPLNEKEDRPDTAGKQAAVTPYVSLLCNQVADVQNSVLLSTVHAVGTAARFRYIWRSAYAEVLTFRNKKWKAAGQQTRDDLENLADKLGDLEFDLTYAVEFPLMRIETFRADLYEVMDLKEQTKTLSQMFDQISGSLNSELTAIEVREGRKTHGRHKWNAFAAGLLTFIGVPVGFVIAFLGINTKQVPQSPESLSMWAPHYAPLYLFALAFALIAVFVIAFPYVRDFARIRSPQRMASLAGLALVGGLAGGSLVLWLFITRSPLAWEPLAYGLLIPTGYFVALLAVPLLVGRAGHRAVRTGVPADRPQPRDRPRPPDRPRASVEPRPSRRLHARRRHGATTRTARLDDDDTP